MPSPVHILVVDDDEITCSLLEEVLSKEGYAVEKALNGSEAIAKGGQRNYEVVLTDIRMAGVNGMEVLHTYRKKSPGPVFYHQRAREGSRAGAGYLRGDHSEPSRPDGD